MRGRLQGELAGRDRHPLPARASSATQIRAAKITTQALVLVGPALGGAADGGRSHVYDPGYGHRYRPLGRPDRYKNRA